MGYQTRSSGGAVARSPVVATFKNNGHKNHSAASARVLNGRARAEPTGPRCIQCLRAPPSGTAYYADVQYRPVSTGQCEHGPFCYICRNRIASCTLPSCVCRAMIRSWGESTWPEGTAVGSRSSTTPRQSTQSKAQVRSSAGDSNGFYTWDGFSDTKVSNSPPIEGPVMGPVMGPELPPPQAMEVEHGPAPAPPAVSSKSPAANGVSAVNGSSVAAATAVNGHKTGGALNELQSQTQNGHSQNGHSSQMQMPPAKRHVPQGFASADEKAKQQRTGATGPEAALRFAMDAARGQQKRRTAPPGSRSSAAAGVGR
mmetsp:Transcript_12353/g.29009  ORF Transcript_12353/g.29009 Transcript_12353/m.29009 type:complete len:313 (-) Transcript_12353:100-1038(-)